MLGKFPLFERR